MTTREQVSENLIITPGQNLTQRELGLLACMAEGYTTPEQAQATGLHEEALPLVEGRIRGKLGARTQAHMIAKAFLLGVLRPRHLMVIGLVAGLGYSALSYLNHSNADHISQLDMATEHMGPATLDPHYAERRNRRGY
jgi:DNA-binding CsgD family transcriptional regulator